jgi:ABC-type polysaccharide/polyol phosphate transport system ATPase subunit
MVLASHSMPLLREWCNRGIFMEQGRPVVDGSIDDAIAAYQASSGGRRAASGRR